MQGMVIAAMVIGTVVIIELCMVIRAPLGYQDEKGFHVGAKSAERAESVLGAGSR